MAPIIEALKVLPSDGNVLDIGCGNGAMLSEIRKLGEWHLFGIDSSESGVKLARSEGLDVRFADANTELLSHFTANSFDLILTVEVIEHLQDPRGLLRQAHTLLKPNGRILLTTPYHGYLKNLLIALAGKGDSHYDPLWDAGHIKFWSQKTLSIALEETGFRGITFKGAGRYPFIWKSMVLSAFKDETERSLFNSQFE